MPDRAAEPSLESLEARRLLSTIKLSDRRVQVVGDQDAPNVVSIGYARDDKTIIVIANGVEKGFNKDNVDGLIVFGGNAPDLIQVVEPHHKFNRIVRMIGGGGNDTLIGGGEHDIIWGDAGSDLISSGTNDDTIFGGGGSDVIVAGDNSKVIFGGSGNDSITVGSGRGYVFGNSGNDTITTRGGGWEVFGDDGTDALTGGYRDTLWGGGGTGDVIRGGSETHQNEFKQIIKVQDQLLIVEPTVPKI